MADNQLSGSVDGTVLQARDIHGSVHQYGRPATGPGMASVAVPVDLVEHEVHGREELLDVLADSVGRVVLCGAGGFGKTTVALALATRLQQERAVWWVDASTKQSLIEGMREVALSAGAAWEQVLAAWRGDSSAPDLLWQALEKLAQPWLLVVDNAEYPADLVGWVRVSESGLVLVTSRDGREVVWGRRTRLVQVPPLSDADGAAMLRDLAPSAGGVADSERLSRRLGGVPLVLLAAGRLLEHTSRAPVVPGWNEPRSFAALVEQIATVTSSEIVGTWELSLDALAARGVRLARPMLRLLSFLDSAPVPTVLLDAQVMAEFQIFQGVQPVDVVEALVGLADVGLVWRRRAEPSGAASPEVVALHPLIRETSCQQADAVRDILAYRALGMALLDKATESPALTRRLWSALTPHCAYLGQFEVDSVDVDRRGPVIATLGRAARFCLEAGSLSEAEQLYGQVLAILRRWSGSEDESVLSARLDVARVLQLRGDLAKAESQYRDVLAIAGRALGPNHPRVMAGRHDLARLLWNRGEFQDAETDLRDVLACQVKVLGEQHEDTLASRAALISMALERDDHATAMDEYREMHAVAAENVRTLEVRYALTGVLVRRGRLADAVSELSAVFDAQRRLLGETYPSTMRTRRRLDLVVRKLQVTMNNDH